MWPDSARPASVLTSIGKNVITTTTAAFECQSKPNHMTMIGATPMMGSAETILPIGRSPRRRNGTRSARMATTKPERQPMEVLQGAPHLDGALSGTLRDLVEAKTRTIEGWIAAGAMRPVDPKHLIFAIWATTQHYADFAIQIHAITGESLADGEFYDATRRMLAAILLDGALTPRAPNGTP